MKIAVASNGLEVSPHLEYCTNYNYFKIEQGMIRDYRNFPILAQSSPEVSHLLGELEIDLLIVGCLKDANRTRIEDVGIDVVCGGKGEAKIVVEDYLADEYSACEAYCDEYEAVYGSPPPCKGLLAG